MAFGGLKRAIRKAVNALGYDIVLYDSDVLLPVAERNPIAALPELDLPDISGIDLAGDPLLAIATAPEFMETARFFAQTAPWRHGFVSAEGLALLYYAVRLLRPANVVEIGAHKGWTTQVLARAAHSGATVHAVGPYDRWRFDPIFKQWPPQLRARTEFYPMNSARFFQDSFIAGRRFDMFFIDGDHDYEFAMFDIQCAARLISPGGFIFVDDADQDGPRRAVGDFLEKHPTWTDCIRRERGDVLGGRDFLILRAP
jgi:predicted O-methyltransferase YrrM